MRDEGNYDNLLGCWLVGIATQRYCNNNNYSLVGTIALVLAASILYDLTNRCLDSYALSLDRDTYEPRLFHPGTPGQNNGFEIVPPPPTP